MCLGILSLGACKTVEEAEPGLNPMFVLSAESVTETKLVAKIVPADDDMGYVALTATKQQAETFDLIDYTLEMFNFYAEYYGHTLSSFLTESGTLKKGTRELRFSGMEPDTDYVLYVFGLNEEGVPLTGLYFEPFRTLAVEMTGMEFEITCQIDGPSVSARVIPTLTDQQYVFTIVSKEALMTSQSMEAYMEEMISTQISYGQMDGLTAEEAIASIAWKGEQTFDVSLDAETDYVALACSVNPEGLINSEISSEEFTTGEVDPSDNIITLQISDINVNSAYLKSTVTNDDQYVIVLDKAEAWKGLSAEETERKLKSEFELEDGINSGAVEFPIEGLEESTEYIVMAAGYSAANFTTAVTSVTFKTLEAGDPTGMTFDISLDEISSSGVTVNISGHPDNALYYWNICPADMTAAEIKAEIDEMVELYISYGYVISRGDFMRQEGSRGSESYRYSSLESGRDYKVYAFGVYEDGDYATDIVYSEVFSLKDPVLSDVTISLGYSKYFDGDDIAATWPQFADWAGNAVVPIEASLNGDVAKYYYTVYLGDITDESRYSDNLIIEDLISNGYTTPSQVFLADYDVEMTMLGVALDADGNSGAVFRKKFSLDQDGVSPADEFNPETMTPLNRSAMKCSTGISMPEAAQSHLVKEKMRLASTSAPVSASASSATGLLLRNN